MQERIKATAKNLRRLASRAYRARIEHLPLDDFERLFPVVAPHTMLNVRRLRSLHASITEICESGIPGDIVECGVARGGSALLMALLLEKHHQERRLVLFDSFEGLPEPNPDEDPEYESAKDLVGTCRGGLDEVRALFHRHRLEDRVDFVKGFYEDTLPTAEERKIAFLHVDCDWYDSVKLVLETFYDQLVPGAIMQIDDYNTWGGCRKAVDRFFSARGIRPSLERIGGSAVLHRVRR